MARNYINAANVYHLLTVEFNKAWIYFENTSPANKTYLYPLLSGHRKGLGRKPLNIWSTIYLFTVGIPVKKSTVKMIKSYKKSELI